MKAEFLNELDKIWPTVSQVRSQLRSSTFCRLSGLRRRKSQVSSSSSPLNNTNSTMQQCSSTCEPDPNIDRSICQDSVGPCEFCPEPSSFVIMTDVFNPHHKILPSESASLSDGSAQASISDRQPLPSSCSEFTFGNELSAEKTTWTSGVNDVSSCTSITTDDLLTDPDRSVFDERSNHNGTDEQDTDDDDSFEVLSFDAPPESSIYIKEFRHTTADTQNNVCDCCSESFLSTSNLPVRRCHYYGKLYCSRCHVMEYACIPAKIITSFDLHLYPVCRRAKAILQSNYYNPIFDIQNDNENLYTSVSMLRKIKVARAQFKNYYAYLSTCTRIEKDLNEKYLQEFYARDYIYQSIHSYSLNDLLSLSKILQILDKATKRARQHIIKCMICREKGFTCEVCKKRNEILYPFYDDKIIGRCDRCSNVYHRRCWDRIDHDCPKCYRLTQRRIEQNFP